MAGRIRPNHHTQRTRQQFAYTDATRYPWMLPRCDTCYYPYPSLPAATEARTRGWHRSDLPIVASSACRTSSPDLKQHCRARDHPGDLYAHGRLRAPEAEHFAASRMATASEGSLVSVRLAISPASNSINKSSTSRPRSSADLLGQWRTRPAIARNRRAGSTSYPART